VGDATVRVTVYSPGGTFSAASLLGLRKAAAGDDVVSMGVTGDAQDRFVIDADGGLRWGSGAAAVDVLLHRTAVDLLKVEDHFHVAGQLLVLGTAGNGFMEAVEQTADPAAPSADRGRTFYKDNGAGKTQLAVRFATGTPIILATEA